MSRCPQGGAPAEEVDIGVSVFTHESIGELLDWSPIESGGTVLNVTGNNVTSLLSNKTITQDDLPTSIIKDQKNDPECGHILAFINLKVLPDDEVQTRYLVKMADRFANVKGVLKGVLYYLDPKKNHSKRLVMPKHLREELIEQYHGGPFAGHFSGHRTYGALYW